MDINFNEIKIKMEEDFTENEVNRIFQKRMQATVISFAEAKVFMSAILYHLEPSLSSFQFETTY